MRRNNTAIVSRHGSSDTHLDAGGHGEGVARQGSRLVHGPRGRHHLHDVLAAAVRAHGETASDHLSYDIIVCTINDRTYHRTRYNRVRGKGQTRRAIMCLLV